MPLPQGLSTRFLAGNDAAENVKVMEQCREYEGIYLLYCGNDENTMNEFGTSLTTQGQNVFIVDLRDSNSCVPGTLAEYILTRTPKDFHQKVSEAKSFVDVHIEHLPNDFIKAVPVLRTTIFPLLVNCDYFVQQHYVGKILNKVKGDRKLIERMFNEVVNKINGSAKDTPKEYPPDILAEAMSQARDPQLIKKRIDAVNNNGIIGERRTIAFFLAALDSR